MDIVETIANARRHVGRAVAKSKSARTLCVSASILFGGGAALAQVQPGNLPYRVVDTGQDRCYDNSTEMPCPSPEAAFFGQDAQYVGNVPAYRNNGDGTVTDLTTGLVWQKTPDATLRTWEEATAYAKTLELAGRSDWRLPTIEELFSIADFRGDMKTRTPYIDTSVFDFRYPDTSTGLRDMDAQYWSSNRYVGTTMRGDSSEFGFNFADGRIKSYPIGEAGGESRPLGPRTFRRFVRCVRGPAYGQNAFVDNGDGTITDRATGLMWTKADSGRAMPWADALAYAEKATHAGYDDWRLPSVKELQTIVDYARAPDARSASARGPAIDPIFLVTETESWYWTSTTHIENGFGYYVCFGRGLSAKTWNGQPMNAHGAGAVRSDPKSGKASRWAGGLGPQSDEIRIANYVRCVRGGGVRLVPHPPVSPAASQSNRRDAVHPPSSGSPDAGGARFIGRLDRNGDGKVSQSEFDGPARHFRTLDRDGDGYLSADEAPQGPPPGGPPGRRPSTGP